MRKLKVGEKKNWPQTSQHFKKTEKEVLAPEKSAIKTPRKSASCTGPRKISNQKTKKIGVLVIRFFVAQLLTCEF